MGSFEDTFRNRINSFIEQISQGVSPDQIDGTGEDGLAAQRVLQAAIESLDTELVVYVR
jgi:predicted dehydrogenase